MDKGVVAAMICVFLTLGISILSGLGFYATMGLQYGHSGSDDVKAAANAMTGANASGGGGGGFVDFTASVGRLLATLFQVIFNLSGIIRLLFAAPKVVADSLQLMFQLTFGISFATIVFKGVVVQ